eukprot:TRINITY_DN2143_c0_g2_i3.p1 TRINITY_DN2143_c0_g2~~TRINITY_DN2143_c0_g2_i3.p1  ORF type:complete len:303 (+),score=64.63 TRINITY_DN2143_c0_g2_i3:206-1114(+)
MVKKQVQYSLVDAFTDTPFKGNPAAVCMLEEERGEEWMQSVAREFNAPASAFLKPIPPPSLEGNQEDPVPKYHLRWFTPIAEIQPCGHGTLAASHFLFTSGLVRTDRIEFHTKAGLLTAKRVDSFQQSDDTSGSSKDKAEHFSIELDFPTIPVTQCDSTDIPSVPRTLNGAPVINIRTTSHGFPIMELSSGKAVVDIQPQFDEIQNSSGKGLIITGHADHDSEFDFITRFFCPKLGINEDPVCGMANCALAPYWSENLGKRDLVAYMASSRGGRLDLHVEEKTERVLIRGKAVTIMLGYLLV